MNKNSTIVAIMIKIFLKIQNKYKTSNKKIKQFFQKCYSIPIVE